MKCSNQEHVELCTFRGTQNVYLSLYHVIRIGLFEVFYNPKFANDIVITVAGVVFYVTEGGWCSTNVDVII